MCGGTLVRRGHGRDPKGLSPRVRGNQSEGIAVHLGKRSIPACAGEPLTRQRGIQILAAATNVLAQPEVYPRVCGGTIRTSVRINGADGLSPRVRGNLFKGIVDDGIDGSIPACAGEPGRRQCGENQITVYPRVCGGTLI